LTLTLTQSQNKYAIEKEKQRFDYNPIFFSYHLYSTRVAKKNITELYNVCTGEKLIILIKEIS
jgi:hypothetical protein